MASRRQFRTTKGYQDRRGMLRVASTFETELFNRVVSRAKHLNIPVCEVIAHLVKVGLDQQEIKTDKEDAVL